ncbi:discoidin domain-containing protein [Chitinispirillales bacterium ANBcel5]|uniref:galactose-binding domain-containing protein n=1 Tax=Cellulosispirillum alkaliphilum TaxID=3039283 RepID=UPI002A502D06|nr:discoidin domain-containing protein [Chitinispirillales bacterium ANBcel5]
MIIGDALFKKMAAILLFASMFVFAETEVHVNQVGYELAGPKRAVVQSAAQLAETMAFVVDQSGSVVDSMPLEQGDRVLQWRGGRIFTGIDFTAFEQEGTFRLRVGEVESPEFKVGERLLFTETSYDALVTFFNAYRCTDEAMRDIHIHGSEGQTHDLYGGWFDASGDPGKHLSHLSFSNYFNPQQIPMVVWSILHALELYEDHFGQEGIEEAAWGADYLLRSLSPEGFFYMSAFDNWGGSYGGTSEWEITEWSGPQGERSDGYECGMRQGGGLSIAALARTAANGISGDSSATAYLDGAIRAYQHLKDNPTEYLNDGTWNILDDYCALLAATELYNATAEEQYRADAAQYAASLLDRQTQQGWFFSDDARQRPFYHAAEEGLVPISLVRYAEVTSPSDIETIRDAVKRNLLWYKEISASVHNPFGYAKLYRNPETGIAAGPANGDLARGKTATASSVEENSYFTPDKALDGDTSGHGNRWGSEFNDDEWFQVDLGDVYEIDSVVIFWEDAYAAHYKIQVSTDEETFSDIVEVTDGNGGREQLSFEPVEARYVRMQGIERILEWGGYSIYSFQVFGERGDDQFDPESPQPYFFIAHENETGYWWQGQNARLSSMSAAMAMGSIFADPSGELWREHFYEMSVNQLNWILGNNPFQLCMMYGYGEDTDNYPRYPGTWSIENVKGGICNGITAKRGTISEVDEDFYEASNPYDLEWRVPSDFEQGWRSWRWIEQWLPHNAWYVIAVTSLTDNIENPPVSVNRSSVASVRQQASMKVRNISSTHISLDLGRALDEATPFAIYDVKGRKVFSTTVASGVRNTVISMPRALASGMYVLSLEHRSAPVMLRSVMVR